MNIENSTFEELKLYYNEVLNKDKSTYRSSNDEPTPIECINEMISKIQEISNISKLKKNYQLNMPQGVKGRSSNNDMAIKILNWEYKTSLKTGLEKTYSWIYDQLTNQKDNSNKFIRS